MRISDWSSDVCSSDLQVRRVLPVSERRTCRVLVQHRSTQRHHPKDDAEEQRLTADIIALAKDYGRYGYRSIHALLGHAGWQISLSVVERIWRREGLQVPKKQPKRHACGSATEDRKNVVWGKRGYVRVELGGSCIIKKKNTNINRE